MVIICHAKKPRPGIRKFTREKGTVIVIAQKLQNRWDWGRYGLERGEREEEWGEEGVEGLKEDITDKTKRGGRIPPPREARVPRR